MRALPVRPVKHRQKIRRRPPPRRSASAWATPPPLGGTGTRGDTTQADTGATPAATSAPGEKTRVGHCVLSRSECSVFSRSFKEPSVLSRSFFEFLATYENGNGKERKEHPVLLQRMGKNAKIVPFFYKERERTREHFVLLQKNAERSVLFSIYIYRYIYIDIYI